MRWSNPREGPPTRAVIATNLALITDEILDFCRQHSVLISTSLDGPRDLHNAPPGVSQARLA